MEDWCSCRGVCKVEVSWCRVEVMEGKSGPVRYYFNDWWGKSDSGQPS